VQYKHTLHLFLVTPEFLFVIVTFLLMIIAFEVLTESLSIHCQGSIYWWGEGGEIPPKSSNFPHKILPIEFK